MNWLRKIGAAYQRFQVGQSPQKNLVQGFLLYTIVGFLLLSLPLLQKEGASLLDHLFIATSAISTTGLVTVGVYDTYNWLGQAVIMVLFQIGGIGYMTLTTYYLLFTTRHITAWHKRLLGTAFTMPSTIKIADFLRSVIWFTLAMELLGAIGFFIAFRQSGMPFGEHLWFSIFHSVSAFCTAGFGLYSDSFEGYADNVLLNVVVSILAIAGSLGFIVITDLAYRLSGRTKQLSFTTKIIVYGFLILLTGGTVLMYFLEPSVEASWMKAFFQTMTAMTTVGFNTVPIGGLTLSILLLVTFLMYIGASPSGTAGGMKITTLTAVLSVLKSRLLGEKTISFMHRKIPFERLYVATSAFILYTSLIFLFTFLMSLSESFELERVLFEVASALGTVGLSTGITGDLSSWGKIFIIILMFIGRVGVLTFGFALLGQEQPESIEIVEDDLAV